MKFFISILLTALLSAAACLYFPWWSIALVAFLIAVAIPQTILKAFATGFTALFFLWGGLALYISSTNGFLLTHKLSLLILKTDSPAYLILTTALIGAMVAGLAAMSGSLLRKMF